MEFPWGWMIFIYIVVGAIMSGLCHSLAAQKNHENASTYAVLGFFFGVLVLVYVAGLPDLKIYNKIDAIEKKIEDLKQQFTERKTVQNVKQKSVSSLDYSDLPPI